MLFDLYELKSRYELEYELGDYDANLNILSKEIFNITSKLYSLYIEKEVVRFHHKANNNRDVYVDFQNVSENTWFRSEAEIKEILYRPKVKGQFQKQFSINKGLEYFGVKEPIDEKDNKKYLQLMYLFYIVNYFAFPNKNIFKMLSKDHKSYLTTYDEGLEQGVYLSFILANLLNGKYLYQFVYKMKEMSQLMDMVSQRLLDIDYQHEYKRTYDYFETAIQNSIKNIEDVNDNFEGVVEDAIDYFHHYAMHSYTQDLLLNLIQNEDMFRFNQLEVKPYESWKQKYVSLDGLDDFLYSDEVYSFCRQTKNKIEVRDKIKFIQSASVNFLKKLIDYDREWMESGYEKQEGLVIEIRHNQMMIYALKIAVIIKTYNDLINKMKVRISSQNKKQLIPLCTLLSGQGWLDNIFPPTLAIRIFLLAAHSQYLNAICSHDYYDEFYDQFLFPEILNMKIFNATYQFEHYNEAKQFLILVMQYI